MPLHGVPYTIGRPSINRTIGLSSFINSVPAMFLIHKPECVLLPVPLLAMKGNALPPFPTHEAWMSKAEWKLPPKA